MDQAEINGVAMSENCWNQINKKTARAPTLQLLMTTIPNGRPGKRNSNSVLELPG